MAEYGCMIGWDRVAIGRERKAMGVWGDALVFYDKARSDGKIEDFTTLGFESNSAHLLGCILLFGDRDKINDFIESEEFQRVQQRASMVVDTLTVTRFQTGSAMETTVGRYLEEIEHLGV